MSDHCRDEPTQAPSAHSPFPRWAWALFALLYGAAIPWWVPKTEPPFLLYGVPLWVLTALLGGLAVAITANVLMRRYWHD